MRYVIFLVALLAPACHQAPYHKGYIEDLEIDWSGTYSMRDRDDGGRITIELNDDGSFVFTLDPLRETFFPAITPQQKVGTWAQSSSMVYLKPADGWGIVKPYRYLKKVLELGDKYLLPAGHHEFLYDKGGDLLQLSFYGGTLDRLFELRDLKFLEYLHSFGMSVEDLVDEGGATDEQLAELGLSR